MATFRKNSGDDFPVLKNGQIAVTAGNVMCMILVYPERENYTELVELFSGECICSSDDGITFGYEMPEGIIDLYDIPKTGIQRHHLSNREIIWRARRKMNLAEIEKQLGYPVEVIE